ncbi:MAG: hypothetical protein U0105_11825 [Candidatus Obscuribacterales bacterium]
MDAEYGVATVLRDDDGNLLYKSEVVTDKGSVEIGSAGNPLELKAKLENWRRETVGRLSGEFNVSLSADGDTMFNGPRNRFTGKEEGPRTPLRSPRIDELIAVERALINAIPSYVSPYPNEKKTFMFIADNFPNPGGAYVWWDERVIIGGDYTKYNWSFLQFQGAIEHELAHQGQYNVRDISSYAALGFVYGWIPRSTEQGEIYRDEHGEPLQYFLLGRDGYCYEAQSGDVWGRVSGAGRPLDESGKESSPSSHPQLTVNNDQMRELALVRPPTTYFTTLFEEDAEARILLKRGERSRADLLMHYPQAYYAAKNADQREIDQLSPGMMRSSGGTLVLNSAENREQLESWERAQLETRERAQREGWERF